MKSVSIFFVAVVAGLSTVKAQTTFSNTSIDVVATHYRLSFSVPVEANVYQYRIEAANDTDGFEAIGTVKPAGNSLFTRTYSADVYETGYKYYRVAQVGMSSRLRYSSVLQTAAPKAPWQLNCSPATQAVASNHRF